MPINKLFSKPFLIALIFGLAGAFFAVLISSSKETGDLKTSLLFLDILLSMIAGLVSYKVFDKVRVSYLNSFILAFSIYLILILFFIGYMCIYEVFWENDFYPLGILIYIGLGGIFSSVLAIPFKRRLDLSKSV